jgi:hypothetical protein
MVDCEIVSGDLRGDKDQFGLLVPCLFWIPVKLWMEVHARRVRSRFDLAEHKVGGRFECYPVARFRLSVEVSDVF